MFRAVLNNDTKVRRTFFSGSQPTDATGTPTVTVERADGTALASPTVSVETAPGEYSVVLTAAGHADQLDRLKLTWSATVDSLTIQDVHYIDVVGSRYFNLGQFRNMEGLGSSTKYPDLYLERVRAEVEVTFEDYCEVSFVPKYGRDIFDSYEYYANNRWPGVDRLQLVNSSALNYGLFLRRTPVNELLSVKLAGTAQTLSDWTVNRMGHARSDNFSPDDSVTGQDLIVEYSHGYSEVPADLARVALRYARQLAIVNISTVPDRSRLMQTEFGLFVIDAAGDGKATGTPEIDAVLNRYREESVGSFA